LVEKGSLPASLRELRDIDPYDFYERARSRGNVVFDHGMRAWLVLDYEGCGFVERREDIFAEPTGSLPGADRIAGDRDFRALTGRAHSTLHHFVSQLWTPAALEPYRHTVIRPIVDARISRLRPIGRAELWNDFASMVPIAVVARVLGLPPMSDETLRRVKTWQDAVLLWRHTLGADPEVVASAVAATSELEPMLLPTIRARQEEPTDDLISGLWRIGPEVAADWNERDVLANVKFLFEAGSETTAHLICICIRILLRDQQLIQRVRDGGEPLARFVDEALRHTTVVHWRARVATQDVELSGVTIRAGDRVHPVNAAANRDGTRFSHPGEFNIDRRGYLSHLAFNAGPRHCAGAWLARFEAQESVKALLQLPSLRLDPDAEPPRLAGYVTRSYRPLHLLFDPGDR
jgi:cytochrome P450